MKRYDILSEPRGASYTTLVQASMATKMWASVVFRQDSTYSDRARELKKLVLRGGGTAYLSKEWPGTRLSDRFAEILVFPAADFADILYSTDRLYGWRFAQLPEDLCFYRSDGSVVLLSSAHERFAEVYLNRGDESMKQCVSEWDLAEMPMMAPFQLPTDVIEQLQARQQHL